MSSNNLDEGSPKNSIFGVGHLSDEDRELIERLKRTYSSHTLESVFQDMIKQDRVSQWTRSSSARRSSAASSTWLSTHPESVVSSISSASSTSFTAGVGPEYLRRKESLTSSTSRGRSKSVRQYFEHPVLNLQETVEPFSDYASFSAQPVRPPPQPQAPCTLYFCTNCDESFPERSAWEKHESITHDPQFYWPCPYPDCEKVFNRGSSFEKHHSEAHGCPNCSHSGEVMRSLPVKRAWGCGFETCKTVFDKWEKRCSHVAAHYEDLAKKHEPGSPPVKWQYSTMIRNLLHQPDVRDAYRRFMVRCHGDSKTTWPVMKWQPSNSGELKRRLEYRDFRHGMQELARLAYQLGHPSTSEALRIMGPGSQNEQQTQLKRVEAARNEAAKSALPQESPAFHTLIERFPTVGQSSVDLYGPVPPSPIVQLDMFLPEPSSPDPDEPFIHKRAKSSISTVPLSLYPSTKSTNVSGMSSPSTQSSIFSAPELVHPFNAGLPLSMYSVQTTIQGAAVTPPSVPEEDEMPTSPLPRPKTPLGIFRQAKGLMKKKSGPQFRQTRSVDNFKTVVSQPSIKNIGIISR